MTTKKQFLKNMETKAKCDHADATICGDCEHAVEHELIIVGPTPLKNCANTTHGCKTARAIVKCVTVNSVKGNADA